MKRILVSSLLPLLTLASLSAVTRADDITFSGFGPNNVFFSVAGGNASGQISLSSTVVYTETQTSPVTGAVPFGASPNPTDGFTFTLSEPGAGTLVSLTGVIVFDNACSGGAIAATIGCSSQFIYMAASDPGNFSGTISVDVNQTFALPATLLPGQSLSIPVSSSLVGDCSANTSGNVNSFTQFDATNNGTSPNGGGTLFSPQCSPSNTPQSFNLASAPASSLIVADPFGSGVSALDIDTKVTFALTSGTITLPTGLLLGQEV